jgi:hypothetical protein
VDREQPTERQEAMTRKMAALQRDLERAVLERYESPLMQALEDLSALARKRHWWWLALGALIGFDVFVFVRGVFGWP